MKAINQHDIANHDRRITEVQAQFDEQLKLLEKQRPKPITLRQHRGDEPRKLAENVIIMPGDYFYEDENENPIVVSALEVGRGKTWEPA